MKFCLNLKRFYGPRSHPLGDYLLKQCFRSWQVLFDDTLRSKIGNSKKFTSEGYYFFDKTVLKTLEVNSKPYEESLFIICHHKIEIGLVEDMAYKDK